MSEQIVNYTAAGFRALQDELAAAKRKMEEVKADVAKARSYGDLSENSEYDDAKNEEGKIAMRIHELEQMIAVAHIIDESEIDESVVSVGSIVKLINKTMNKELTYHIVGSYEADPLKGKISDASPIGLALIGASEGDTVVASTAKGALEFKVLSVTRAKV